MEDRRKAEAMGSAYAGRFAFLLLCRKCKTICRELGKDAYTADIELNKARKNRERCPICNSYSWDKIRRIEKTEKGE